MFFTFHIHRELTYKTVNATFVENDFRDSSVSLFESLFIIVIWILELKAYQGEVPSESNENEVSHFKRRTV